MHPVHPGVRSCLLPFRGVRSCLLPGKRRGLAPSSRWRHAAVAGLLALLAVAGAGPTWAQARFDFDRTPGRLSKQVVPSHYALTLDLDPARDTFNGEVVVTLRVREPVAAIELHAEKLEPERLALEVPGATPRAPDRGRA